MTINELEKRSIDILLRLASGSDYNVHFDSTTESDVTYHGLYLDDNIGLNWYYAIGRPASEKEIADLEKKIEHQLPTSFRSILLSASSFELNWELDGTYGIGQKLYKYLATTAGRFSWGDPKWLALTFNQENALIDEYNFHAWKHKLPIFPDGAGNYIAIDLEKGENYGRIVWLDHEQGDELWEIASSFDSLLEDYSQIGFAENYGMFKNNTGKIDANTPKSRLFRKLLSDK